ncbi:glycosyltransferase family 2 protein [candidate division KSB1 bacterium]|nr:glycosyltransferase family 2 protein [candidate division KSB1 bacterium]NIV70223.1 glycosyltransferase [Phycisphaerae bacterium]NIR71111.1 glycosyltransferase family 2 protein [candidate division KSB1 bacterium]NIS26127.1 glycosyltransferase family 2 protein [candidate division KSB1 bacterium]NIT74273.1 glycosyltransferase family 2 protein [candidate division KSB1 bacterium]
MRRLKYIIITPARNEEAYIEKTIQSIVSQTILPAKWVIVSDGSTDRTDKIVQQYMAGNPWINLVRMPDHRDRHFAGKVRCFNAGYESVKDLDFDIIGNLDADISFDQEYFQFLLNKFAEIPTLGVAGTPFVQDSSTYDYGFTNIEHVSGACQLFRRECFEDIGGYVPIKSGGIDWIAVTTARMKGWKTRTFTDKTCLHHRKIGTGNANILVARFRHGIKDYYLAGHPIWQLFRAVYQMKYKPYIIGGCTLFAGYLWAFLCRYARPVSKELMMFHRKEQMVRLKRIFLRTFKLAR